MDVLMDPEKVLSLARSSTDVLPQQSDVPRSMLRDQFVDFQCILLNTFSTVAIVFMNKKLVPLAKDKVVNMCR